MEIFGQLKNDLADKSAPPEIVKTITDFIGQEENISYFKNNTNDSLKNFKDIIDNLNLEKQHKETIFIYIQSYLTGMVN